VLENANIDRLFTFQELDQNRNAEGSVWTFDYTNKISPEKGGEYSLFFANCLPQVRLAPDVRECRSPLHTPSLLTPEAP
jgi:hypothetical protein